MSSTACDLLQSLVRIPSVNERGNTANAKLESAAPEAGVTRFLRRHFEARGWSWLTQRTADGAENLVALAPGGGGDLLLLEAHQDTIGVEGMRIDPFAAKVEGGRVWGRGACDVKGGMAAVLAAADRLAGGPVADRPRLLLAFTVNEEAGFTGVRALARIWEDGEEAALRVDESGGLSAGWLAEHKPSAAVVMEPTGLDVVVAHKGTVRWKCEAIGRAAHSSDPSAGANAVYAIARVIAAVESYHREVLAGLEGHPLCGGPTVCVTTVAGGVAVNAVPDRAAIDIDRRLQPGEEADAAREELIRFIRRRVGETDCRIEHDEAWMSSVGLPDALNGELAGRVSAAAQAEGAAGRVVGAPYGTNAFALAAAGIPTVVFGPGSIEQAHTDDEWISIDELDRAVRVLCRLAGGA
ncbi:MAG: M20/M25/M40 family metallo-hydrolase [Planctomycetota bacterium]